MSIKSTFSQLPPWAKGVVAVIGVAALVGVGFMVRKQIKKFTEGKGEREEERELIKDSESELQNLLQQGTKPTISDLQARTLVNTIFTLLDGCELSGSEKLVVDSILKTIQNQADWVLLQQQFGRKKIDNCGIWTGDTNYDLKTLLTDQLDAVNWNFKTYITVLKEGLTKKGIIF